MKDETSLGIALDDARSLMTAVVALITNADQQAITLLGIYMALCTATVTGAGAALVGGTPYTFASASLITSSVWLFAASCFCFLTMWRTPISNPGRGPDFWLWAIREEVSLGEAVTEYLTALEGELAFNRTVSVNSAGYLFRAKLLGLITPILAAAVAAGCQAIGIRLAFAA